MKCMKSMMKIMCMNPKNENPGKSATMDKGRKSVRGTVAGGLT